MAHLSNIIQRRDLEPLLNKAHKVVKHYEKAANCAASVMGPDCDNAVHHSFSACGQCANKTCSLMHREAVEKARKLGGSYIYVCQKGSVFWTSPFYSGERFAGALISGGVEGEKSSSDKVKALAQMMLVCADQISEMSFVQKSYNTQIKNQKTPVSSHAAKSEKTHKTANESHPKDAHPKDAYPMDMERTLLASLRRGDKIEASKILVDLLGILHKGMGGNFDGLRLKAMELAVLLSRSAVDLESENGGAVLDTDNRYLKKIEESANLEEITQNLCAITERMSGKIFSFHGVRHFSALRKAERYIWENYTRKISLQEIADVSGLSAPYFSTIFKDEMGENLSSYLNRLRVERAASMLVTTNMSINGIASACGFEDQSWFSKIFKGNTGLTPGKYREQGSALI